MIFDDDDEETLLGFFVRVTKNERLMVFLFCVVGL
jgi:hypothetical protein